MKHFEILIYNVNLSAKNGYVEKYNSIICPSKIWQFLDLFTVELFVKKNWVVKVSTPLFEIMVDCLGQFGTTWDHLQLFKSFSPFWKSMGRGGNLEKYLGNSVETVNCPWLIFHFPFYLRFPFSNFHFPVVYFPCHCSLLSITHFKSPIKY